MAPSRLRREWILAMLAGEFIGFAPPALTGAALATAGASDAVLVLGLTVAGCVEGLAIGIAQALVLRRHLPTIDGSRWVAATAVAAGVAWFAGMGGSSLIASGWAPIGVLLAVVVPWWIVGLFGMGVAQWLVLRAAVPASSRWIWVTSGAWLVGVTIPVVALSIVPNGWPAAAHVLVAIVSALSMGVTVGALTGATLERFVDRIGTLRVPASRRPTPAPSVPF